jgi:hypothetical protein
MSFSDKLEQFEHFIETSSIEKHSKYDFEVLIDYEIDESKKKNHFMLEMFYFIPKSLQINKDTYSKSEFYNDLNSYTRFKTPSISLKGLIHKENDLSPLIRIKQYIKKVTTLKSGNETHNKILYEIRLLGCVVRVYLRDQSLLLMDLMQKNPTQKYKNSISAFIKEIQDFHLYLEKITQDFNSHTISSDIREAFDYVSQFISLQVEIRLTNLVQKINWENLLSLKVQIVDLI